MQLIYCLANHIVAEIVMKIYLNVKTAAFHGTGNTVLCHIQLPNASSWWPHAVSGDSLLNDTNCRDSVLGCNSFQIIHLPPCQLSIRAGPNGLCYQLDIPGLVVYPMSQQIIPVFEHLNILTKGILMSASPFERHMPHQRPRLPTRKPRPHGVE